jgi:hypothetical protein
VNWDWGNIWNGERVERQCGKRNFYAGFESFW